MKRKIAAIFASDIAQYTRLVAEDEEETVRRLTSLRKVVEDFITRDSGRVFSLAGDAIYAEFPSAVDAVRCAIDIQESLRTRNLAYPTSRHMNLRIGITIGDVVDRDGALMGDGVNIAARLEGISDVGGICVSRAVYEQVANKLSVQFSDIGEQQVKNIPTPVHAFMVQMRPAEQPVGHAQKTAAPPRSSNLPAAVIAVSVSALGIAALAYFAATPFLRKEMPPTSETTPVVVAPAPARTEREVLVPEMIPFITDRARVIIRDVYLPAADHKAIAIGGGTGGFITEQRDEETAKSAALASCERSLTAGSAPPRARCELYAVGNVVVWPHGRPPMPPQPWIIRDPSIERPLVPTEVPLVSSKSGQDEVESYLKADKPKAMALSPTGAFIYFFNGANVDESVRRSLERCGSNNGVACMIVAIDDDFVVPIPRLMKPVAFFRSSPVNAIAPTLRDDVVRRLGNSTRGWNAVAGGAGGRVGIALGATSEEAAIDAAMADCNRQERDCRVIVLGPFVVERLPAPAEPVPTPAALSPANPESPVEATAPGSQQSPPVLPGADTIMLSSALASAAPRLSPAARDDLIQRYEASRQHKALAVVPGTFRIWRSFRMGSADNARNKVLEGCQVYHDAPCALIAINVEVQRPIDGKWPVHDMERVRYTGPFDPNRIPALNASQRRRPDITGYDKAVAPKSVAYHPTGTVFIAAAAASQREAEQQALTACNDDPARRGRFGPCYLYAVGNEVVLPQRRTAPLTP